MNSLWKSLVCLCMAHTSKLDVTTLGAANDALNAIGVVAAGAWHVAAAFFDVNYIREGVGQ